MSPKIGFFNVIFLRKFLVYINECQSNPCHVNANCTNIEGSYTCKCNSGFSGDGTLTCSGKEQEKPHTVIDHVDC